MQNPCGEHPKKNQSPDRVTLREIIEHLPEHEGSGWSRHRCPFCAYNKGYENGLSEAKKIIEEALAKRKEVKA